MRLIATLLNLVVIAVLIGDVIYRMFYQELGIPYAWVAMLLAPPLFSLIAIRAPHADDWLSLYFKRKALEERKKIERLNAKDRE
jgi:hypothetical protein